jgi:hypothetical protein
VNRRFTAEPKRYRLIDFVVTNRAKTRSAIHILRADAGRRVRIDIRDQERSVGIRINLFFTSDRRPVLGRWVGLFPNCCHQSRFYWLAFGIMNNTAERTQLDEYNVAHIVRGCAWRYDNR